MRMTTTKVEVQEGAFKELFVLAQTGSVIELGTHENQDWCVHSSGIVLCRDDKFFLVDLMGGEERSLGVHGGCDAWGVGPQGNLVILRDQEFFLVTNDKEKSLGAHQFCDWLVGSQGVLISEPGQISGTKLFVVTWEGEKKYLGVYECDSWGVSFEGLILAEKSGNFFFINPDGVVKNGPTVDSFESWDTTSQGLITVRDDRFSMVTYSGEEKEFVPCPNWYNWGCCSYGIIGGDRNNVFSLIVIK